MNFSCDKCQRRYSIADDKVRGRAVKIRCKNCQNIIAIQGPDEERTAMMSIADVDRLRTQKAPPTAPKSPWEEEATRAQPALDVAADWFAMIKGKQTGPFKAKALVERVSAGEVTVKTYLWRKGMADWKRASDIPELSIYFAGGAPPPLPAGAPAPRPGPKTGQIPAVAGPNGAAAPAARSPPPPPRPTGAFSIVQPILQAAPAPAPAPVAAPAPAPAPLSEIPWASEPILGTGNGSAGASDLGSLFGDDLDGGNGAAGSVQADGALSIDADPTGKKKAGHKAGQKDDPFAALTGGIIDPSKLPPPGESTSFFIAQAGVNKRNPVWKIALFIFSLIAIPVSVLYALSTLKVVPLEVTRVDETGHEVKESFFSAGGVSELKDRLLGKKAPAAPDKPVPGPVARAPSPRSPSSPTTSSVGAVATGDPLKGLSSADVKDLYAGKADVGPKVRHGVEEQAKETGQELSQEQISKVVAQASPAFKNCIEAGLKRNPNFKGGKVTLTATVASSGIVKHVEIDRADLNRSDIGECVKDRAKRLVFPPFGGDDVNVEIPLFLGVTY